MAARNRPTTAVAPRRRSKTVWPFVFAVLVTLALLILLAFALGWIDVDAAGSGRSA